MSIHIGKDLEEVVWTGRMPRGDSLAKPPIFVADRLTRARLPRTGRAASVRASDGSSQGEPPAAEADDEPAPAGQEPQARLVGLSSALRRRQGKPRVRRSLGSPAI